VQAAPATLFSGYFDFLLRSTGMADKSRLQMIAKLVREHTITNQAELQTALKEQGFDVTQSNISRDLKKLKVSKINGIYHLPGTDYGDNLRAARMEIVSAGTNLIVVKTGPGIAPHIALLIDRSEIAGVLGTIAGDDTIFCALRSDTNHVKVIKTIHELCR
jgi:transcriptional regulator of arginine metabolism